jgi:hypothetical protein
MEEDHEAGASENVDAGVAVSRVCGVCGVWCECTHQALGSRERTDAAGLLQTPCPADKFEDVSPSDVLVHGRGSIEEVLEVLHDVCSVQQASGTTGGGSASKFDSPKKFEELGKRVRDARATVVLRKLFLYGGMHRDPVQCSVIQEIWIQDKNNPDAVRNPFKSYAVAQVHHHCERQVRRIEDIKPEHLAIVDSINVRHICDSGGKYQGDNSFFDTYIESSGGDTLKVFPDGEWLCSKCGQANDQRRASCRGYPQCGASCAGIRPCKAWKWGADEGRDAGLVQILKAADETLQWPSGTGTSMARTVGDSSSQVHADRLDSLLGVYLTRAPRRDLAKVVLRDAAPTSCHGCKRQLCSDDCPSWHNLHAAVLCIGLGEYKNITRLPNAAGDARELYRQANAVQGCRAELMEGLQDAPTLIRGIRRFLKRNGLQQHPPEAVLVVGCGHGMQKDGKVYLIPEGASDPDPNHDPFFAGPEKEYVALSDILHWCNLDLDEHARRLTPARTPFFLLIFDACRVRPGDFQNSVDERCNNDSNIQVPAAYSLCFSCSRGSVAMDGRPGDHSPFAQALLDQETGIFVQGRPLKIAVEAARQRVGNSAGCSGQKPVSVCLDEIPPGFCLFPARSQPGADHSGKTQPQPAQENCETAALENFLIGIGFSKASSQKLLATLESKWVGSLRELKEAYTTDSLADLQIPVHVAKILFEGIREQLLQLPNADRRGERPLEQNVPQSHINGLNMVCEVIANSMSPDDESSSVASQSSTRPGLSSGFRSEDSFQSEDFDFDSDKESREIDTVCARNVGDCDKFEEHMQTIIKDFLEYAQVGDGCDEWDSYRIKLGDATGTSSWTMSMLLWTHFAATAKLPESLRSEWCQACKNKPSQDKLMSVLNTCLKDHATTHKFWDRATFESGEYNKDYAECVFITDNMVQHYLNGHAKCKDKWSASVLQSWLHDDEPVSDFLLRANRFLRDSEHSINGMRIIETAVKTKSYVAFMQMPRLATLLLFGFLETRRLDSIGSDAGAAGASFDVLHGFCSFVSSAGHVFSLTEDTSPCHKSLPITIQGLRCMSAGPTPASSVPISTYTSRRPSLSASKRVSGPASRHEPSVRPATNLLSNTAEETIKASMRALGNIEEDVNRERAQGIFYDDADARSIHTYLQRPIEQDKDQKGMLSVGSFIDSASGEERQVDDGSIALELLSWSLFLQECNQIQNAVMEDLRCPVSRGLLLDPVTCSDGHTYERACIVQMFRQAETELEKKNKKKIFGHLKSDGVQNFAFKSPMPPHEELKFQEAAGRRELLFNDEIGEEFGAKNKEINNKIKEFKEMKFRELNRMKQNAEAASTSAAPSLGFGALATHSAHEAIKDKNQQVALALLQKMPEAALRACDGKGESLLHAAARFGLTEVALGLLSLAGDDIAGMQNELGETALHVAIKDKNQQVALALLQKMPEAALRACDGKGESLLHAAARFGLTEVALGLISLAGDDIAGMQNELGETALHVAIKDKNQQVALALLQKMPEAALRACDGKGDSTLHLAVRCGLKDAAIKLVEQLGEECRSESWEAAVHLVIKHRQEDVFLALFGMATDKALGLVDERGMALVELAVEKGLDRSAARIMDRVWEAELRHDVARVEALWHKIVEGNMTACVMLFDERGAALLEGKTLREFAAEKDLDGVLHVLHVRDALETCSARMRRISDADNLRRRYTKALRPLYQRIGHRDARRDRQEWRERLDENVKLERRERDVESDFRILCGDIDDRLKLVVLRDEQFIVAFFLSSTFTDTEWERNLLISDVLPYLAELARKYGLELRLAEMRWGIRAAASSENQTSEICMNELERCQRESLGISYIFLACQKYGFRPFPPKIPEDIFASLRDKMSAEDAALLDKCFELDTNVYVPPARADTGDSLNEWSHGGADSLPGPVFVLKSSTRIENEGTVWWPTFEKLQVAFRKAAREVWPDWAGALRDPRSQAFLKKFFISVTEEEFSRGLLWQEFETQQHKTLVFRRTFLDLSQHIDDTDLKKFIDVLPGGGVHEEAQQLLRDQLGMVPSHVKQIEYPALQWAPGGINPAETEHRAYLCNFLDDFTRQMMVSIREAAQKLAVTPDELVDEVIRHLKFALERAGKFMSTTSTAKVEAAAREYLSTSGAAGVGPSCTSAFVIFGRSGSGKTYLLSKVLEQRRLSRKPGEVTVIRFLGTTPLSSNVHAVLTSICEQLRRAYGKAGTVPSDWRALRDYFHTAITVWPTDDAPLKLFIDSLDQLDDSNGGRRLDWLPATGLPPHVRVVVSTLPDYQGEFQCMSILQTKLGESQKRQMVEVETISEPERVLQHLLHLLGRTLTKTQREHVLEAFTKRTDADAAGTPLWLTIVSQAVARWASFESIRFAIKPGVRDLIIDLFERLEKSHGGPLVRAVLAYITIAKGVSETEINHLAALDDAVLADVYEWWVPPVRVVPPLLVTRLLTELAPFLTRRGDGSGAVLVSWYHRQFWEAAQAWLFGTGADGDAIKVQRHQELADYLSGFWAGVAKPYSEALKICIQKPYSEVLKTCIQRPELEFEFFPDEAAADRQVPLQPLVLEGNLLDPSASSKCKLNVRRIRELVRHLIGSGQIDRLVQELTSPLYVAAKVALRQVPELLREYAEAEVVLRPSKAGDHAAAAAAELARCRATVGRFLKHLEQQPPLFALQMCFQEPDQHPLCIEAGRLLQELQLLGAAPRVVHWMGKPQHFDPCQLEINEHKGTVHAVCFCRSEGKTGDCIASASGDGTIKITSAVSGEVVLELKAHDGREVYCLDVNTDGTRMASGGGDATVRLWETSTGKCLQVLKGHRSN